MYPYKAYFYLTVILTLGLMACQPEIIITGEPVEVEDVEHDSYHEENGDEEDAPSTTIANTTTTTTLAPAVITNAYLLERNTAAMQVLQNKCMNCHASAQGNVAAFPSAINNSNSAWLNNAVYGPSKNLPLVVAGQPASSLLLAKIVNPAGGPFGTTYNIGGQNINRNMPTGSTLTLEEAIILHDWVALMNSPNTKLFIVRQGTGGGNYNTTQNPITMKVGEVLRLRDADTSGGANCGHLRIHTSGGATSPFEHDPAGFDNLGNGALSERTILRAFDNTNNGTSVYNHDRGQCGSTQSYIYFRTTN